MAANSSAYGAKAGYNQSGGDYLLIVSTITPANLNVLTPGTGSGGVPVVAQAPRLIIAAEASAIRIRPALTSPSSADRPAIDRPGNNDRSCRARAS